MAFTCKNKCGAQEVEWLFINNAWLPVTTVCSQDIGVGICPPTCSAFTTSTFLWDACFTDTITKTDNNVTDWKDINTNLELIPVDDSKDPGFTVSSHGGADYNMLTFNGTSQGLGCGPFSVDESVFTVAVVVNNLATNLAENLGTIFTLLNSPFLEQIILGYENNHIVLKHDTGESLIDIVEPVAVDNGFHLIVVRHLQTSGTIELIIDGNTSSADNFSFDQTVDSLFVGSSLTDYALSGEIGWLAYYDSAISDGALSSLISYAANKFHITLGG